MDIAVQWVEAYLQMNGYFTVAEYQVIEALDEGGYRTATDLDIMAVRFPGAGRLMPTTTGERKTYETDPALGVSADRVDLIIGEVKEGTADINAAARNPEVLTAALARFGAAALDEADDVVSTLIKEGEALSDRGFRVRLMTFGTRPPRVAHPYQTIDIGHIASFIRTAVDEGWDLVQSAKFSDPVLGSAILMEKARRAAQKK